MARLTSVHNNDILDFPTALFAGVFVMVLIGIWTVVIAVITALLSGAYFLYRLMV